MGQEEALPPVAAVAFSWEHEQAVQLKAVPGSAVGAPGMRERPRKAPAVATVVLPWEHDPAVVKPRGMPDSAKKTPTLARRLSVPPPPGRPLTRSVSRAVRPEDDPFLAAYLACTKSTGHGDGKRDAKGRRLFAWAGLGLGSLSCKRGNGVVEQSTVRVAGLPEVDPRDALID